MTSTNTKRRTEQPGSFTKGLLPRHYKGHSPASRDRGRRAMVAKKRRVQWLEREHSGDQHARVLAAKLRACSANHRCYSGACQACAQAAQESFVEMTKAFHREMARKGMPTRKAVSVTIVPTGLTSQTGKLGDPTLKQVHRRFTDCLAVAKVTTAICVLEVALTEHEGGRYEPAWVWHAHGLGFTRHPKRLAKRLATTFPRSDAVPRPIRTVLWDGSAAWLRYCYKLERRCRVGIDNVAHFDIRTQAPRKSRGTKPRSLTPNELLELLLFHDRVSLDSRIVTKGAQLRIIRKRCRILKLPSLTRPP